MNDNPDQFCSFFTFAFINYKISATLIVATLFALLPKLAMANCEQLGQYINQLNNSHDNNIRGLAISSIQSFGTKYPECSIPVLISYIGDPKVKFNISKALLDFQGLATPQLAEALMNKNLSVEARDMALNTLVMMKAKMDKSIPDVIQYIEAEPHSSCSNLYEAGSLAAPEYLEALRRAKGKVHFKLHGPINDQSRNDIRLLNCFSDALMKMEAPTDAIREILEILDPVSQFPNDIRQITFAGLGNKLGRQHSELVVPILLSFLKDKNESDPVKASILLALGFLESKAAEAVGPITDVLLVNEKTAPNDMWESALGALLQIGTSAQALLPHMQGIILNESANPVVRLSYASAMGNIADTNAFSATVSILTSIVSPDNLDVSKAAIGALESYSQRVEDSLKSYNRIFSWERKLNLYMELKKVLDNSSLFDNLASKDSTIKAHIDTLEKQKERLANEVWPPVYWASAILLGVIASLILLFNFWLAFRRRLLVLLGRRWVFATGDTPWLVDISLSSVLCRNKFEAGPAAIRTEIPENNMMQSWADRIREHFSPGQDISVIVDESQFSIPWSKYIGGLWSYGSSAIIAGQQIARSSIKAVDGGSSKFLKFQSLSCAKPEGWDEIPWVEKEVESITACAKRWGATANSPLNSCTRREVLNSIQSADIVHIACHAESNGIYCQDGKLSANDISSELNSAIRCKFIILSACSAGDNSSGNSISYRLLEKGINVLSAIDPVNDTASRIFFEEFYKRFLFGQHSGGIKASDAIRQAIESCKLRVGKGQLADISTAMSKTVNSYILYGDPTIQLYLKSI